MKQVYIYKKFERFWHWSQAALILFLALTGFEIHGSFSLLGFEKAVLFHRIASYLLLALIAFSIFWHFTTGEWKQYIPTISKLKEQIQYYTVGIFKNAPHPTIKSARKKLNPLQAMTYLGFKLLMAPVMILTGLLYLYYKTFDVNDIIVVSDIPLEWIAWAHTLGAWLLMAFIIVHVYMTTTGHTVTTNIKAMITGWELLEEDEQKDSETNEVDEIKKEIS
ncbi:cytochrome b/b6 domain-containing protein [Carboxylicivirga sp. A043]|uniref:cytochrome b/b6 domain-containing protein n=1 Tax=Carboxylicivirga litoralis TaxID=2816963 RepID=UPI0021CB109F|nr:cytochrome b/b6 domain-containing protein [Carboxylicivirga sp. A043]MCU4156865.1 cytochrome b/b6 domain-containing protein [Carboxylicivirga sp. A043]